MTDTAPRPAMAPSRPFIFVLSALAITGAAIVVAAPQARTAAAAETLPLSTALTPEMIDYFGLSDAFARPSIAALVTCSQTPACGGSDSSRVRIIDGSGRVVSAFDGKPNTIIEHVRSLHTTPSDGVTETRLMVRQYVKDDQGRIVVNGTDSIVKLDLGGTNREPSTLTRVHRYNSVRYLVNDLTLVWPITGLVVLELSHAVGPAQQAPARVAGHAAVSFDGTRYAQILTTGALMHRADLSAKRLETTMPDR